MLTRTGSMASTVGVINPIRYRGYYFDEELDLYYLQTRYYDQETGRFISPDVVAENGNLYAYCVNDPVNNVDPSGCLSDNWKSRLIKIAIGVALAAAAIAITVVTGGAAAPMIAGIVQAVVIGGVIGGGVAAVSHRVGTGSWDGEMDAVSEGILDGMIDGYMLGSAAQLVGAIGNAYSGTSGAMSIGKGATPTSGTVAQSTPQMSQYSFSKTAAKHAASRPYYNSVITQQHIVDTGVRAAESATRFKYVASGSWSGIHGTTQGTFEIVIDIANKTIYHLLFRV